MLLTRMLLTRMLLTRISASIGLPASISLPASCLRSGGAIALKRPDVIVDLALRRQSGAIKTGHHSRDAGEAPTEVIGGGGIADVIPAVAAVLDAEPRGELRLLLDQFGIFGVEKHGQPCIFTAGYCSSGRLRHGGADRRHKGNGGGKPKSFAAHGVDTPKVRRVDRPPVRRRQSRLPPATPARGRQDKQRLARPSAPPLRPTPRRSG